MLGLPVPTLDATPLVWLLYKPAADATTGTDTVQVPPAAVMAAAARLMDAASAAAVSVPPQVLVAGFAVSTAAGTTLKPAGKVSVKPIAVIPAVWLLVMVMVSVLMLVEGAAEKLLTADGAAVTISVADAATVLLPAFAVVKPPMGMLLG